MRKLALLTGGFSVSIFVFVYALRVRSGLLAACVCLLLGVVFCAVRRDWAKRAALILLSMAVGFGWCGGYWQLFLAPLEELDGQTIQVRATAADYSRTTQYGAALPVVFSRDGKGYAATLYDDAPISAMPGDTVEAAVKVKLTGNRPGEEKAYLGAKGTDVTLSVRGTLQITPAEKVGARYLPQVFAHKLRASLDQILDADSQGFMKALLTGERSGLSFAARNEMSVAGLYHALAISGMHISILTGLLLTLLGNRRHLAAMIGLPVIWFYALAVGAGAPVVRACIMQSFLLLAPLLKREADKATALLTALALILLPNPRAAGDVALQLSFASIAGIFLFTDRCFAFLWGSKPVKRLCGKSKFRAGIVRAVTSWLSVSAAVVPATLPLSAVYFGLFSLIAPVSSILILPVITLCFAYGILVGLAGMLFLPAGALLALPLQVLIRYCMRMAQLLSKVPFASVYTQSSYMVIFLVFLYAVIVLFAARGRKSSLLAPVSCSALMLCLCLLLGSMELDRAQAVVTMLDVGQGQCIYLESGGVNALYDCGGDGEDSGETAARYLLSVGRRRLDALVISHYDADHANGAAYLLSRIPVAAVYLPQTPDENGMQGAIVAAAEESGTEVVYVTRDLSLDFGSGKLQVYAPVSERTDNDGSLAALFSVAEFDALFTGDMSVEAEQALLLTHDLPDLEVLAAGHHGAGTSTSSALLRIGRPELALISVGADNSYGHPSEETIARLEHAGVQYCRTDECGSITVRR